MRCCVSGSVKVLAFVFLFGGMPVLADSTAQVEAAAGKSSVNGINNLKGFFIGVDAAYNYANVGHKMIGETVKVDGEDDPDSSNIYSVSHKSSCFVPSITVGYSYFFENWYAGLAADVSFGRKRDRTYFAGVSGEDIVHARMERISGEIKVKGGCYFQDLSSVVYGITGVKWKDVSYELSGSRNEQIRTISSSRSRLESPLFVVGVGVEHLIGERFSFSAEYEYAWRRSSGEVFSDFENTAYGVKCSVHRRMKHSLKEHSLRVGLKYHF